MAIRFETAPLVELIAEVRWGGPAAPLAGSASMMPFAGIGTPSARDEEFFMTFGGKASPAGYGRVERLIPPGFPVPPFQVVYRFRKSQPEQQGTTVYQIGPGIFPANITPPYRSWDEFRPVVRQGVELLLASRSEDQKELPLHSVSLRYIDSYGKQFTAGEPLSSFLKDKLGFAVELPPALADAISKYEDVKFTSQLRAPLKVGQQIRINIGDGFVNNEPTIVVDTTIVAEHTIAPTIDEAMTSFERAHEVHRDVFVGISKKLHHIMKPVREER
jgi:uncharacterized protein (TIGR04255 family)